jgi:hypothetical protein
MAVRRRYVSKADVADAPIEPAMPVVTQAAPPEPPATPMPAREAAEPNALQRALESQVRAEEIQRQNRPQPQQPQSVEGYIDQLPGLTDHKREFLKQFPGLLAPDVAPIMGRAYQEGLQSGLKDDSEDLDRHILETVTRTIEHQAALTSPEARSTPENAQRNDEISMAADDLTGEAEGYLEESLSMHAPPPPPPRRSIPFSAPVSREVTMSTGGRPSGTNTLSREEREIAHISFPHLAKTAAEFEYLKNRKRMQAMKADGRIQGDR